QNGMALIPRASVAWQHAFGDMTPTAALSFQSIGSGFNILVFRLRATPRWSKRAAICSSPRRPRSASPMRANSPTARTTIRSRAISPGGFDFHFAHSSPSTHEAPQAEGVVRLPAARDFDPAYVGSGSDSVIRRRRLNVRFAGKRTRLKRFYEYAP